MRNRSKQNFYLYYLLDNNKYRFLYTIRNCKRPEQTKEYKRLQSWLNSSAVKSIGWCDQGFFEDYKPSFIYPNLKYININ